MIHKTTRSILSVFLAALLLVASIPLTPAFAGEGGVSLQSESGESEGLKPAADGTAGNPYKIATANDLREFAKLVNAGKTDAWAELTDDIDLSGICSEESDTSWTPIGNEDHLYTGTFDGNGHTISGLYINSSTADDQGLFGYVSGSGKIENLSVSGSVSGNNYVGGVVGLNRGSVEDCDFTGSVSGSYYVGGVVGENSGSVINCTNTDSVKGSGIYVGGVVGNNSFNATVTNCYNTGSVSGPDSGSGNSVGGVVGCNSGTVENCYNTGTVNGSGNSVGGVVGDNGGTVENCYNTGTVTGTDDYVGGVVGWNSGTVKNCYNIGDVSGKISVGGVVGDNGGTVENCYNTGTVTGPDSGGIVGYNDSGTVTGCYFLTGTAEKGIGNKEDAEGATAVTSLNVQSQFKGWDFSNTWRISQSQNRPVLQANAEDNALSGTGKQEDPYKIYRAIDLKNFRDLVNDGGEKSAHAKLMNNINLSSVCGPTLDDGSPVSWTPIGSDSRPYSGTFNGDGHTISGLYIDNSTANNQGLFGCVYGGTVKNLNVSGTVSNVGAVGGIVNVNSGRVENCTFSGSVKGSGVFVGGVVGNNGGTVENCYNTGKVTGSSDYSYIGGVVGYSSGGASVTNCYNTGEVSGGEDVGGVVGYNAVTPLGASSVTNCYNTGEVSGPDSVNGETTVNVGGVVGDNRSSVTNCYNTGEVSGIGSVGGIVGYNVDFDGYSASVENCYNTGTVSGSGGHVDGVVGDNKGTVKNCYYQIDKSAIVGSDGTTADDTTTVAKTAAEFHSGEVAYLLQSKQTAGSSQVWGQAIGEDKSPVLTSDQEKNVYKVTINLNDSDSTENETRYTNSDLQALTPTREGYTFDGWYESADCSGEAVTTITDLTDTTATLYAKWKANEYKVTLHTNDGTIAEGQNVTSYIYGVGAKLPTENEITKTGYIFAGWYNNADLTGDPVTEISKTDINDKAYWAKWEEVENPDPDPTKKTKKGPEQAGPSTGDSTGWDDILDELENAAKGDEITIDMGDETKVPAEIFESLAGKDVEISFDLGDVQWSVNGADIPTDTDFTDIDLGVDLGTSGIPVNVINTITGEVGTVQITLAHNGEFGFTMTLTAPLGKENAGYWANLYHYDEEAEALNFEAAAKIDEDGSVTIPFSHASQYAIVIDTHSHATVDVSDLFIDIAPDAWYKDAIQYAYDNGLMTGVSATEFAPEQTTTRAMIVSILARLEGVTTAEAAGFADVDDNDWYATAVNWAANVGVVNGYEDNTFKPNTAITREQLAAILMNYAAYKGEDVSNRADLANYTDQPSTWAEEAMSWAVAEGLISGVTNDQLQPQGNATRAQVAAILQRYLEA